MMANHVTPPFYQLGRRITCHVWYGDRTESIVGEVMDTEAGWIAIKSDRDSANAWFNLDYVVSIEVEHSGTPE